MNCKHLLFGLLLFSVFGWGQINFEVSVSKKQLGLNERLRVDFKIDKPGDNFRCGPVRLHGPELGHTTVDRRISSLQLAYYWTAYCGPS
ncbi:MAG: hypothetical protein ACPH7I_05035, partial [Flavobacteriaceae bacterium]